MRICTLKKEICAAFVVVFCVVDAKAHVDNWLVGVQ